MKQHARAATPLEEVERLYQELVHEYGDAQDREIRAASKLLLVALLKLKEHGGLGWNALVQDYILMLQNDPARYERVLEANRGEHKRK